MRRSPNSRRRLLPEGRRPLMLNQATMDMLTAMKMSAMAAEFANQLKDPAFNELGFEERLGLLVNAEWNRRQCNKLDRFIRNAHFAVSSVNDKPCVPCQGSTDIGQ